jgi:hypothetical protein
MRRIEAEDCIVEILCFRSLGFRINSYRWAAYMSEYAVIRKKDDSKCIIPFQACPLQISQHLTSIIYKLSKRPLDSIILVVGLDVSLQVADPLREDRDLHPKTVAKSGI